MKIERILYNIELELNSIKFPYSNRKITTDSDLDKPQGFVLGLTKHRFKQTIHISKHTEKFFHLFELITQFVRSIAPKFEFTSIQVNKNVLCKPHKDVFNNGDSLIFGLGTYENGGELVIESIPYDIKRKVLVFDGSKSLHWVNNWEFGDRYTITCYSITSNRSDL